MRSPDDISDFFQRAALAFQEVGGAVLAGRDLSDDADAAELCSLLGLSSSLPATATTAVKHKQRGLGLLRASSADPRDGSADPPPRPDLSRARDRGCGAVRTLQYYNLLYYTYYTNYTILTILY